MKIGFIGLGVMGRPMAKNLIKAGHKLLVFDRVDAAVEELAAFGASASKPKEIAAACAVIITMLPNGPHVKSVMFDEKEGLSHFAPTGTLFIDMSSIAPNDTKDIAAGLAKRGQRLVDAPVSGAYAGAVEGTLAIMAGGSDADVAEALPLLETMGGKITHIGPTGCGSACKLCNQIMIAASLAAVSESMMLAKKIGCDINKVFEAVKTGFAGSNVLNTQVPHILEHTFQPGFKIDLHLKDLRNVEAAAREYDAPIPVTEFVLKIMQHLHDEGLGGLDNSGVAKYYEELAGMSYVEN